MTTNERHSPATLAYIASHAISTLPNRAALYVLAAEGLNVEPADAYAIADNSLDAIDDDFDTDADFHLNAVARTMYSSDDDFDDFRLELREALDMLDDDDRAMMADDD